MSLVVSLALLRKGSVGIRDGDHVVGVVAVVPTGILYLGSQVSTLFVLSVSTYQTTAEEDVRIIEPGVT